MSFAADLALSFKGSLFSILPERFSRFMATPSVDERIDLLISNGLFCSVILVTLFLFSRFLGQVRLFQFWKLIFAVFISLPMVLRYLFDYAYDTPFAFLAQVSDMVAIIVVVASLGGGVSSWFRVTSDSTVSRLLLGCAALILVSTLLVVVGLQKWLGIPSPLVHFALVMFILFRVYQCNIEGILNRVRKVSPWYLLLCLPLLPQIFAAAPQDADITSQAEILGMLFQGFSVFHIESGVPQEWFDLRYPVGFAAMAWSLGHLLNMGASEITYLLNYLSFLLLAFSFGALCSKVMHSKTLLWSLLCINGAYVSLTGFGGGQTQEAIAYALCLGMCCTVISRQHTTGGLFLAASLILQPMVAVPFCVVFACSWLHCFIKSKSFRELFPAAIILGIVLGYLVFLVSGESLRESQPLRFLHKVDYDYFSNHLWREMAQLKYLCLLPLLLYLPKMTFYARMVVVSFGISIFFTHGIWGGFFTSGYGQEWLLILGFGIVVHRCTQSNLSERYRRFLIPAMAASFLLLGFLPISAFYPASVYNSHSDVRMAKYISKNLPQDALMANLRVDAVFAKDPSLNRFQVLSFLRGDSYRNTVFFRLSFHQVKTGNLIDRGPYERCTMLGGGIRNCLNDLGVTHIFVSARPQSRDFSSISGLTPLKSIGSTFLYEL